MKTIITLAILILSFGCTKSQNLTTTTYPWSSVSLLYHSGPLPPPYQYEYTLTITTEGRGILVYAYGANNPSVTYEFKVSADTLAQINDGINAVGLLEHDIEPLPFDKTPIGGSTTIIRVVIADNDPLLDRPPQLKQTPPFPSTKKEEIENLSELLKRQVPKEKWEELYKMLGQQNK
ncbi:MAG: hypothetical protein ACP5P3_01565 [Ignavibacteria bacterium]